MTRFDRKRLVVAPVYTSALTATSHIWHSPRNNRMGCLVAFSGRYKPGSEGQDDARFIRRTLRDFYELYPVDGIVIDCRELVYEWGDDLSFPNRSVFREESIPLVVVLQAAQSAAYAHAIDEQHHRYDLDAALFEISEAVRALK